MVTMSPHPGLIVPRDARVLLGQDMEMWVAGSLIVTQVGGPVKLQGEIREGLLETQAALEGADLLQGENVPSSLKTRSQGPFTMFT